jgi:glutaredoxin
MHIVLYSRRGCHLCELVEDWLACHAPDGAVIDVDAVPEAAQAFGLRVPVVEIDGVVVLEGRFDEGQFVAAIRPG